jgi:hypothetical protein
LMNIAFLPLHRLNTRIHSLFGSTDRSLSLSFSRRRKRNGPIILPLSLSLSLSLDRQSEEKEEEEREGGERKAFIISGDTKEPFVHLLDRRFSLSLSPSRYIFIIISMRDESRAQHISSSPIVNYRPDV